MSFADRIKLYAHDVIFQAGTSFLVGMMFGPFSRGLFSLLIFTLFYEFIYYLLLGGNKYYWNLFERFGICCASFLGWIVSRTIFLDELLPYEFKD